MNGNTGIVTAGGLSLGERDRLTELETTIERGLRTFVEVGSALMEIRDSRLYRQEYGTFEDYCQERWGFTRMRASQLISAAEVVGNVNHGLQTALPASERQVRPLAALPPDEQRDVWREAVETAPNGKITGAHVQRVVDEHRNGTPHVSHNSGNNEWYTPPRYTEAARAVMGSIDLDPASSVKANELVGAREYYTVDDDGLEQPWAGRVWMNPPYSQPQINDFAAKVAESYTSGAVDQACVLVNNATETRWFQTMLRECDAVCFVEGRVKFIDREGHPSGAPLQGQAILYFGSSVDAFKSEFARFGVVLHV